MTETIGLTTCFLLNSLSGKHRVNGWWGFSGISGISGLAMLSLDSRLWVHADGQWIWCALIGGSYVTVTAFRRSYAQATIQCTSTKSVVKLGSKSAAAKAAVAAAVATALPW